MTQQHPDIGKRVVYEFVGEKMVGTLGKVLEGYENKYEVDEDMGTSVLVKSYRLADKNDLAWWKEKRKSVTNPMTNPMTNPQDMNTWKAGDLIRDRGGDYRRILRTDGEGELRLFDLSRNDLNKNSDDFKHWYGTYTAFELKESGYTLATDEPERLTLTEVAKRLGYEVEIVEK